MRQARLFDHTKQRKVQLLFGVKAKQKPNRRPDLAQQKCVTDTRALYAAAGVPWLKQPHLARVRLVRLGAG